MRPRIDVSELPTTVYGHRAPLWWGVVGLIVIESMVFALMVGAYYYLRGGETVWPPPGDDPPVALPALNLIVLLASAVPMHLVVRETDRGHDLRRMRFWLLICTVMSFLFLVGRAFTISQMGFRWDSHAYGSVVWGFVALHSIHALTSVGENAVFLALLYRGPVEEKHLLDLRLNALYYYFVVASWAVLFAVIYFDSGIFRD